MGNRSLKDFSQLEKNDLTMKKVDTSKRTREPEIMDDFDLRGPDLEKTLSDLDKINKWLGGNKVTIEGIQKLLEGKDRSKVVQIIDVGCGNGNILREIARWGRSRKYNFELTGVDANKHAIGIAERASAFYPEIKYRSLNIFEKEFQNMRCDIVLCTLTLHHFTDAEIKEIMKSFYLKSGIGVVVNDLHRSRQAYYLFRAFCKVFINNEIARKDGLTSILRGFKKKEIQRFATEIPSQNQQIKWKWAYRYQWTIKK